ncbi:BPTI/Kunitz-type proteinase inhibitor domain-containing protein [Flavobacterium weaverense]|uniref:BPTI/Kunitz-type proteinase inhibitor domain-containing protein n=1 Tax=Flavobacterium weaverense TaxID=271156 RepID=UPI003741E8B8
MLWLYRLERNHCLNFSICSTPSYDGRLFDCGAILNRFRFYMVSGRCQKFFWELHLASLNSFIC